MVNTHHLELFYYVARHGGIVKACRHIPYGIQQPAVSAQLISLEKSLGVKLFERKPFSLTAAGKRIYDFINPFFSGIKDINELIFNNLKPQLRITGVSEFLKIYLPDLFKQLKKEMPDVVLRIFDRNQSGSIDILDRGDADLAITVLEQHLPPRIQSLEIIRLPMIALIPSNLSYIKNEKDLFKAIKLAAPPLISLPDHEKLTSLFQSHLESLGYSWPVTIEAGSIELVEAYANQGLGWGLSVKRPDFKPPKGLIEIVLKDFPKLPIAAFWKGSLPPCANRFLDLLRNKAANYL